jgi:hypothetical protein
MPMIDYTDPQPKLAAVSRNDLADLLDDAFAGLSESETRRAHMFFRTRTPHNPQHVLRKSSSHPPAIGRKGPVRTAMGDKGMFRPR